LIKADGSIKRLRFDFTLIRLAAHLLEQRGVRT
jgi:hypothetical protein